MITQNSIEQIIHAQHKNRSEKDIGLKREALDNLPDLSVYALIVSGVRRCGKSTLPFSILNFNGTYHLKYTYGYELNRVLFQYYFEPNGNNSAQNVYSSTVSPKNL